MIKDLVDSGMKPGSCCDSDNQAAAALAQGHPKSGRVPVKWGMRDRTCDGDGPDDNARDPSFGKGKGDCPGM